MMAAVSERRQLAFQVDADEVSAIIYAFTNAQARRAGANELNTDWDYVTCARAPGWDHLCPHGPSNDQLFAAGWHFECVECSGHAYEADGGVMLDGDAYCDWHADPYVWREPARAYDEAWNPYAWRSPRVWT